MKEKEEKSKMSIFERQIFVSCIANVRKLAAVHFIWSFVFLSIRSKNNGDSLIPTIALLSGSLRKNRFDKKEIQKDKK